MTDVPMICYWKGVEIGAMPRGELEHQFIEAHREIERLRDELSKQSIEHIRDLARLASR